MLTEIQIKQLIVFIERLRENLKYGNIIEQAHYDEIGFMTFKEEYFFVVEDYLREALTKRKTIYARPLMELLNSLFKIMILLLDEAPTYIMSMERIYGKLSKLTSPIFNGNIIPDIPFSFEDHPSLSFNWIREIKKNVQSDKDKALEFYHFLYPWRCLTFLCSRAYYTQCMRHFNSALMCCRIYSGIYNNIKNISRDKKFKIKYKAPVLVSQYYQNNKCLVFSEQCCFKNDLVFWVEKLNIPYKVLPGAMDIWVRDILIDTERTIYIRSLFSSKNGAVSLDESLISSWVETRKYFNNKNYYSCKSAAPFPSYDKNREILSTMIGRKVKNSIRALEGGNYFEVVNSCGQKIVFIGIGVLLYEIDMHNMKHPESVITYTDSLLYDNNPITCRYRKIFNTPNIYWLDQWAYHLDLQMAFIGKNLFILHSFRKTREFLQNSMPNYLKSQLYQNILRLEEVVEPVILEIERTLLWHGFTVIKCCAVLYSEKVRFEDLMRASVFYISSSFINGIDICTKNGEYLFLTTDSPNLKHKEYFQKTLRAAGVTPIFLKVNDKNAVETVNYIKHSTGALRCQTNFVRIEQN